MNADAMRKLRGRYGMLFQSGALLQSLTVAENVALPLTEHTQLDAGLIDTVVKMKLEQVGLTVHGHKKPSEISGGMMKRAALARSRCLLARTLVGPPRSCSFPGCRAAVVPPRRTPLSTSLRRTHVNNAGGTHPIVTAIDSTAAHSEGYSPRCSCTIRTARSRTSGENFFDLFMAPFSQELEPPQNPGRFSCWVGPCSS